MHQIRKRTLTLVAIATTAIALADAETGLPDPARIVVAIRYLQPKGTSQARLFLYAGDGKLLREFANDSKGQDRDPIFSPDGKTIVFRRELDGKSEFFRANTEGGVAQRVAAVPSWYFGTLKRPTPHFDFPPYQPLSFDPKEIRIKDNVGPEEIHYPAPDSTTEIVLKLRSDADPGRGYFGKEPWLREKDKPEVKVSQLPFTTLDASSKEEERRMRNGPGVNEHYKSDSSDPGDLDGVMQYAGSPFIWRPPLGVAIVRQHRGSTFGEGLFAVDLSSRTLHEIAPTGGKVFAVPGEAAFFCVAAERYLPLGDDKRTVNCSFLDLWDAQLQRIRFCAPRVAEFYGGCLYLVSSDQENVTFLPGEHEWP